MTDNAQPAAPLEYQPPALKAGRSPLMAMARAVAVIGIFSGFLYGYQDARELYGIASNLKSLPAYLSDARNLANAMRSGIPAGAALALIAGGLLVCCKIRRGRALMLMGAGWMTCDVVHNALYYPRSEFYRSPSWDEVVKIAIFPAVAALYMLLMSVILTRPTLFRAT